MNTPPGTIVHQPKSMPELVNLLVKYDIPIERYGLSNVLPLQALLEQVLEERVKLVERNGKLIRSMNLVTINVFYQDGEELLELKEDRQVRIAMESKTEIKHTKSRRKVTWSVSRKIRSVEQLREKAILALKNELGLDVNPKRLLNESYWIYSGPSAKFPKLKDRACVYGYDLYLKPSEFQRDGYSFEDKYLRSYFYWKKVKA